MRSALPSRWLFVAVATVVATASLGACGSSGSGESSGAATSKQPTTLPPAHQPPGGFGQYIRGGVPRGASKVITVSANGRYGQTLQQEPSIHGKWGFAGGRITFVETGGAGAACVGKAGTYAWAYKSHVLRLSPVNDPCGPRKSDFALGPFTKRP
jgi:hypothetical protein